MSPDRGRRLRPFAAVPATVVACLSAWALLVFPYFGFRNDDIYVFTVARQQGLGTQLLGLNLFSHFAPFNRLLHWVVLSLSPLDVRLGFAVGLLLMAAMLAAFVWLLGELRVGVLRQCVAVLVVTLSISMVGIGTWWGTVIHIPTSLCAIFLVLAAHVRAIRRRSWRWHLASVLLLLLGFTTQERTLYAPAIAMALDVLVLWRDLPPGQALRRLWTVKWPLVAMFAISAAGGAFVVSRYFVPAPRPHLGDVLLLFPVSFFQYFVPALLGFFRDTVPMPWDVALAITVVVVALLLRTRPRNLKPLLFFAVVYLLYYGLLAVGRLGIYSVDHEASDLQYVAYVVPFCMLALATVEWPRIPRDSTRRAAAVTGVVALSACLLTTGVVWEHRLDAMQARRAAHDFLVSLRESRAQWDSASVSVLPLRVPTTVAAAWIDPYGREETFLQLLQPGITPGLLRAGTRTVLIDDQGDVHDAVLQPLLTRDTAAIAAGAVPTATMSRTDAPGCYHADAPGAGLFLPLGSTVSSSPLLLRLDYSAPADTSMGFAVGAAGKVTIDALRQEAPVGEQTLVVNLDGTTADSLSLDNLAPGGSICLRSLSLVRPLLRDQGQCRGIDRYGALGDAVSCEAARR